MSCQSVFLKLLIVRSSRISFFIFLIYMFFEITFFTLLKVIAELILLFCLKTPFSTSSHINLFNHTLKKFYFFLEKQYLLLIQLNLANKQILLLNLLNFFQCNLRFNFSFINQFLIFNRCSTF